MITFRELRKNKNVFRSLTGMGKVEFARLITPFSRAYHAELAAQEKARKKPRQRQKGGGRKGQLNHIADKLLFILIYFRLYPIQAVQGYLFGFGQAQACEWIHRLTPLLHQALGYEKLLPARNPEAIEQALALCQNLKFIIDGTERPINRPKKEQGKFYSGKKKRHTVKNNVLTEKETGKILGLSATVEGKKSDKKLADEQQLKFPKGSQLWQDKGYQGYAPDDTEIHQPKKKPKGKLLTEAELATNQHISMERIGVEHSIGGVKIFRIVKDTYRNHKADFVDIVMAIACGLFNLRLDSRSIV